MYQYNVCSLPEIKIEYDEVGRVVGDPLIDQSFSHESNRAENGFPRSDISAFMHAESEELRRQLASKLEVFNRSNPNSGLSDEELLRTLIPRNVQSFHDCKEWMSSVDELGLNKALSRELESLKQEKSVDSVSEPVVDPVIDKV